jgi:drug/metabolite transporter (DMT)-like permease
LSLIVFIASLASALFHALWNALARSRKDPGAVLLSVTVANGVLCLPALALTGLPAASAWPWAVAGAVANMVTMRALMETYRRAPFAFAYPLMRGVSPLFVTVMGWAVLGDHLSAEALAGIGAISAAVLMLALSAAGGRVDRTGVLLTLLSGLSNAVFVMMDTRGVRLSGNPVGYGCVMGVLNAVVLLSATLGQARVPVDTMRREPAIVLACASLSMASYLLVLYGLTIGPVGAVAALRETSIFIAVLLAAFMLRERVGPLRWAAAAVALGGVVLIRLG